MTPYGEMVSALVDYGWKKMVLGPWSLYVAVKGLDLASAWSL